MISGNALWNRYFDYSLTEIELLSSHYSVYNNRFSSVYTLLQEKSKIHPNKVFLYDGFERISFLDLLIMVDNLASYLKNTYKISNGSYVASLMLNSYKMVALFIALQKLGAVFLPLPTKYTQFELDNLIEGVDIKLFIADNQYKAFIKEKPYLLVETLANHMNEKQKDSDIPVAVSEENLAIMMFTSGTTGKNKAALIRNFNIAHAALSYVKVFQLNEQSKSVLAIPMYNITGLVGTMVTLLCAGGTLYVRTIFKADDVLSQLIDNEIDFFHASPTVLISLLEEGNKSGKIAPSVRLVACGSSNMPLQDIKLLNSIFPNSGFRPIYGLTESSSPGTIMPIHALDSNYVGSAGLPIPGFEVKVCDESNSEVSDGLEGEIFLRGSNVIRDYFPENFSLIDEKGWLNTGDVGKIIDNHLYILDRKKDIINRGGEKIYSFEIEKLIHDLHYLDIKEVALVAYPDHKYGEVPVAVISTFSVEKLNIEAIKKHIDTQVAKYKRPVRYVHLEELPKSKNGKIDKKLIRNLLLNQGHGENKNE